jgi:septal ring-binding cell division protein DamX
MRQIWAYINVINFRADSPETSLQLMLGLMTLSEVCKMREEQRMADETLQQQVETLTGDVATLAATEQTFEDTITAEIAALKASPAAADPVVATAIANIEAITAKMAAATAAATPAPVVVADPTPVAVDPGTGDTTVPAI